MDESARVDALENDFEAIRKDIADIKETLRDLTNNVLNASNPTTATPFVHTPNPATRIGTYSAGPTLKPATPNDFDGARDKGRAFLNSCELYMSLAPRQFADDQARIGWTLSYMKSGRASLFADRVLRYQSKNSTMRYADWATFRTEFVAMFCPRNEGQHALTRLETDDFHQGRRTVDEYTDEFRDLIELAGYTDGLVIVMKYRRGLSSEIQAQIATMTVGRPKDNEPEEWYDAAALCDENRRTNAAFVATKSPHATRTSTHVARTPAQSFRAPPHAFTPTYHRALPAAPPPSPALPPGIPMDIDAARRKFGVPPTCYRCGKTGHLRRDCPRQDARQMTIDEKHELVQQLLADLDAHAATTSKGEEEVEAETADEEEDFTSRSG